MATIDADALNMQSQWTVELNERSEALNQRVDELLGQASFSSVGIAGSSSSSSSASAADAEERGRLSARAVPNVAVCGVGRPEDSSAGARLFQFLREAAATKADEPIWVDLREAASMPFEDLDALLLRARTAMVCPDVGDDDRRSIMAQREGLKAVLMSCPPPLNKVLLLSRIGAQAGKGGINMRSFFGLSTAGTFAGLEEMPEF